MLAKRFFDFCCAGVGLFFLAPVFLFVSLLIKGSSRGPVFFKQVRVGQHGALFRVYKFRTMVPDAEKKGVQVSSGDDPRITKIGHWLRKYKIDELPQLLNVVRGEMSLVGPRPEVPRYVEAFREEYNKILTVKPGITDYASLEYRNENDLLSGVDNPEETYLNVILPAKIVYYHRYIEKQSLWTDIGLILKTLKSIIC